jgi:hypothetical protein
VSPCISPKAGTSSARDEMHAMDDKRALAPARVARSLLVRDSSAGSPRAEFCFPPKRSAKGCTVWARIPVEHGDGGPASHGLSRGRGRADDLDPTAQPRGSGRVGSPVGRCAASSLVADLMSRGSASA